MEDHVIAIGALVLIGAILHLLAYTELEEFNWFDIILRNGPPFEDLSGRGQLLVIASWICALAAGGLLFAFYMLPRLREVIG